MQLYVFSVLYGVVTLRIDANQPSLPGENPFHGFNSFAYATVATLTIVSFILKYLDNVAKCFCAALSMLCVALLDSTMNHEAIPMHMTLGIFLTGLAFHSAQAVRINVEGKRKRTHSSFCVTNWRNEIDKLTRKIQRDRQSTRHTLARDYS